MTPVLSTVVLWATVSFSASYATNQPVLAVLPYKSDELFLSILVLGKSSVVTSSNLGTTSRALTTTIAPRLFTDVSIDVILTVRSTRFLNGALSASLEAEVAALKFIVLVRIREARLLRSYSCASALGV